MARILSATPMELWRDIILEAESACELTLQEEVEAYLVFLLIRFTNQPEMAKQIVATQFLESSHFRKHHRAIAFQSVGDLCLLYSGLFPGVAEKRAVKLSYFVNLGQASYAAISRASNDIYYNLASQFVSIMDVLQSTRGYVAHHPDLLPLEAYDLWHEVGSQRALKMLQMYTLTKATPPRR